MSLDRFNQSQRQSTNNSTDNLNSISNSFTSLNLSNNENIRNSTCSTGGSSGYSTATESNHNHLANYALSSRIIGYCAECGLRIANLTDACHALGYLYHNNCFVCCCCKRSLRGRVFYKDQDKVYCDEDYLYCGFQQTVEKCTACGHIITETILIALGKTYHPSCFRCCICSKCLDGQQFTIDSKNNIYCLTDYHLVYGSLCGACGLVIAPEKGSDEVKRIVALDREFHVDCYRCLDCSRLLGDEPDRRCYPFNKQDPDEPGRQEQCLLCLNCHLQRIGAIPATSGSFGFSNIPKTTSTLTRYTVANNFNLHSNNSQTYNTISSSVITTPSNNKTFLNDRNQSSKINLMNYTGDWGLFGPSTNVMNNKKRPDAFVTVSFTKNLNTKPHSTLSTIKTDLSNTMLNN